VADPSETTQVSRQNVPDDQDELLGAVRSLAIQVGGLQAELHALRHEARTLPPGDGERPGWEEGQPLVRESPAWVRSVDSPGRRGLAVPWLLLEILFLIAVAVLAASASLDAPVIAAVMVVAWLLVVAGEWIASRAAARERALVYGVAPTAPSSLPDDPTWFAPSAEDTIHDVTANDRAATRLPPAQPE
jgi:hypothetical protein